MSNFKGTKGKWSIFLQDDDIHIENEFSSEAIATLVGWNDDKEGLANSKLISCAPEMLDMLEQIIKESDLDIVRGIDKLKIKKLIKKATE